MSKALTLLDDIFEGLPEIFKRSEKETLSGISKEFAQIFNGRSDFEEYDDKYVIELEVPGVKKGEIEIILKNDRLKISWNRKREKKSKIGKKRYERAEGSFERNFYVEGANPENVTAELKDGVLTVIIPKKEEAKTKEIKIV